MKQFVVLNDRCPRCNSPLIKNNKGVECSALLCNYSPIQLFLCRPYHLYLHPHAIWYQKCDEKKLNACVSLVNDTYVYEIFDLTTGTPLKKGQKETLSLAKKEVLNYFDKQP